MNKQPLFTFLKEVKYMVGSRRLEINLIFRKVVCPTKGTSIGYQVIKEDGIQPNVWTLSKKLMAKEALDI